MTKREQVIALKAKHPELGPTALAERVGCNVSTARAAVNGYAKSRPEPRRMVRYAEMEADQRIRRIRELHAEGRSWAEIGRAVGYRS